jgi:hypothetical protein
MTQCGRLRAEFRYDRDPVGMLQGLTAERVINIGTVSKSLAPTAPLAALPAWTRRGDRGSQDPRGSRLTPP